MTRDRIEEEVKEQVLAEQADMIHRITERIYMQLKRAEIAPIFREQEIVNYISVPSMMLRADRYGELLNEEVKTASKLTIEELAHTTAPPDAETWKLHKNYIVFFDCLGLPCRTYNKDILRTYCPHAGDQDGTL